MLSSCHPTRKFAPQRRCAKPKDDASLTESGETADGRERLAEALAPLDVEIGPGQIDDLASFAEALWSWNAKINLTRHTEWSSFATRDVIDAWQLARLVEPGESVMDLGSGGGLPGVVIGILRGDVQVTCLEQVGKKARAVADMVERLDLGVEVVNARVQEHLDSHRYDTVVVRAVGKLEKLLTWIEPHWERVGRMLVVKGPSWTDERYVARQKQQLADLELRRVASYPMGEHSAESVILQVWPRETDQVWPRVGLPDG